jgi:hypothetical protein
MSMVSSVPFFLTVTWPCSMLPKRIPSPTPPSRIRKPLPCQCLPGAADAAGLGEVVVEYDDVVADAGEWLVAA